MPFYCFESEDEKHHIELEMSDIELHKLEFRHDGHIAYRIGNMVYYRDFQTENASTGRQLSGELYSDYSDALAVHPSQIPEAIKYYNERGISVEFNEHGQPKRESRAHYKALCEARGFANNDGGYSDAQYSDRTPVLEDDGLSDIPDLDSMEVENDD